MIKKNTLKDFALKMGTNIYKNKIVFEVQAKKITIKQKRFTNFKNYKTMKTTKKLTRKYFCEIYPEMKQLKRNYPYDFEVHFNDWKRIRQAHL